VDSRQANVAAQIKLTHQALFDPAARDGPCQLVIAKRHHLQPTVLVQSRVMLIAVASRFSLARMMRVAAQLTMDHGPVLCVCVGGCVCVGVSTDSHIGEQGGSLQHR